MLKAKTLKQLATINCPNSRIYGVVVNFLERAGVDKCTVSPDGVDEVTFDGITLVIGTNCLYAINEQGTKIDNLLDKNCKLKVMNKDTNIKVIYKK